MLDISTNEEDDMSFEDWLVAEGHNDERLTEDEWEQILHSVPEDVDG